MKTHAQVVIIGAGIVGCSAAYHLAQLGWHDCVVIDQGPLFATGGSTSHAPGLVFQTNSIKAMCELALRTVKIYNSLELDGEPAFYSVGSLEVAYTPERWQDLRRRRGYAASWGLAGELLSPSEARQHIPLLDDTKIYGAYYVPTDGIAKALRAAEALARGAMAAGVEFHGNTTVTGFDIRDGRVRAVETDQGRIEAEYVLICAGIWGPKVGRLAGIPISLTPVEHQYVRTGPLPELAGETREVVHPILRHQDRAMYFRQIGDSYGIGSYYHEPLLRSADEIRRPGASPMMPSLMPFTPDHFERAWESAVELLPALRNAELVSKINGMFSFTPDGQPLMGESHIRGLWLAEAIWVTQGGGAGQAIAEWMVSGAPWLDLRECDLHRFEPHVASPSYVRARGAQQYREVYDIIHPLQQMEQPRPLRVSPFYQRQLELGAHFFEGRGWERPQWYEANAHLVQGELTQGQRSGWAARNWSPIIAAEHQATRTGVALFDMTPLTRIEVVGNDALAFLQRLTTNQLDLPIGSLVYTAMCDVRGGVRSDVTVARLDQQRFQVACNGPQDLAWMRQNIGEREHVFIHETTAGTCGIGLWGPRAREVLQPLCDADLSNEAFPYLSARQIYVGEVPVLALRVSYVGELGWELYTSADYGLRLWDLLWQAGQPAGIIAAGRGAFDSLRLEKGYRLWGNDMHTEYTPYEAGIGFTVKLDKGEFIGREALQAAKAQGPRRKLSCLVFDDPTVIVLGKEPILIDGQIVGYVTSANFGYTVGKSIAYGYLPPEQAKPGSRVEIEYFGERYPATVAKDPLFDPKGERLRQ